MLGLVVGASGFFKPRNCAVQHSKAICPRRLLADMVTGVLLNHLANALDSRLVQASTNESMRWIKPSDIHALKQLGFGEEMNHRVLGKVGNG